MTSRPHAGRDVVRLRTNVRGEEVHVYRLDVPAADAHVLLLRYLEEVNQLRERPQWYNALTDNCTTAIQRLARSGERQSWWSWKLFVNGYLNELAYNIGAIDRSLPFAVLHPTGDDARRRWEAWAPGSVPGSARAGRHRR